MEIGREVAGCFLLRCTWGLFHGEPSCSTPYKTTPYYTLQNHTIAKAVMLIAHGDCSMGRFLALSQQHHPRTLSVLGCIPYHTLCNTNPYHTILCHTTPKHHSVTRTNPYHVIRAFTISPYLTPFHSPQPPGSRQMRHSWREVHFASNIFCTSDALCFGF